MKTFKVNQDIVLEIMNRPKFFIKGETILEDAYTNTFPEFFTLIGYKDYKKHNQKFTFVPLSINDVNPELEIFNTKEKERKTISENSIERNQTLEEVQDIESLIQDSE